LSIFRVRVRKGGQRNGEIVPRGEFKERGLDRRTQNAFAKRPPIRSSRLQKKKGGSRSPENWVLFADMVIRQGGCRTQKNENLR